MPLPILPFAIIPWGKILVVASIILAIVGSIWYYGEQRYKAGFEAADAKWAKSYDEKVKKDNLRMEGLEKDSRIAVTKLEKQKSELEVELGSISKEVVKLRRQVILIPATPGVPAKTMDVSVIDLPHDATGTSAIGQCKDSIVYLGNDFTKYWNQMNDAVNRQLQ